MSGQHKDYVAGLDGLRAASVSMVILGHVGLGDLIPGGMGVTIFFFISGFLITRLLWSERDKNGGVDLLRFYGRRTLRLLPEMLVLLLVLSFIVGPLLGQHMQPLQALAGLTYWTNYYIISGLGDCGNCAVTGHLWSLAVEEHFYLVMPLAMLLCGFVPRRLAALFLIAIIGAAAWRTYAYAVLHVSEVYTYKATECRIDSIAWGCLAAVIERKWPAAMTFVQRRTWLVFGAGAATMLASLAYREPIFRETLRYSVQGLALVGIILPLVAAPRAAPLVRILEIAPLRWMGRRSYAAYLWHMLALTLGGMAVGFTGIIETAPRSTQLAALPFVVALSWIFAELSYRFVYTPAQKLKPYVTPGRRPAGASATHQTIEARS
ncbi:acyltransferase family protein [Caulobacter sp.]|uniref:acyltransferase family protein n=1 Tax=Caulobacter sp. TaxID=78 RepID=UPI003BAD3C05